MIRNYVYQMMEPIIRARIQADPSNIDSFMNWTKWEYKYNYIWLVRRTPIMHFGSLPLLEVHRRRRAPQKLLKSCSNKEEVLSSGV